MSVINSNDEHNRKLIENDTSTNFFVEAGAGSGKTTELVKRMLAMVENGVNGQNIDISQICAITFTKAAANEFYDRFQKALIESKSPKAKEALKNIDLCFMGTIDSFTNMIISEHPSEAKVPADSQVIDATEMNELMRLQLTVIANGAYGKDLQDKYERFVKYCPNSEQFYLSGLNFLMNTKNVQFEYEKPPSGNFSDIFKSEIAEIVKALKCLCSDRVNLSQSSNTDKLALYYAKLALKLSDNFEENFDAILRALNKLSGKSGLRFAKDEDLDAYEFMPAYVKSMFFQTQTDKGAPSFWQIKDAKEGGNPFHKREFDNFKYSVAMDFITHSSVIVSQNLKLAGKLSFNDYLFYLKETLKCDAQNGGKLINHIYSRHKYYLIDEFQDTDPVQAEIFFYLTASNLNTVKSWKECIPYPGSLFIVGDPKQSIYRFRNADVASYLNVKKLFENNEVGQVLCLSKNFRSHKPLCSWFNDAFSDILQNKPGIQSAYEQIPLDEKPEYQASLGGAEKQIYLGGPLNTTAATSNLVTIINEIVDNDKYTIEDPPRKVEYKDIMVISYKKGNLKFYMDALAKSNIPYWVEGNVLFDDCPALSAISAILNLVVNPESKKAQAGVKFLTADGMSVDRAKEYKKRSSNLTSVALVSILIEEQNIIAQYGTKNIEYMYYAVELLRDAENNADVTTHGEAARFISNLVAGDTDIERCLQFATDDNRVHLANLHKVKGLQAPVVIMTEAKMKNYDPQKHVDYMSDIPKSCIFELTGEGFGSKLVNWNNEDEKKLEAEILEAEKDRLLYVAATRAKSLFIATDYTLKSGGQPADNQAVNLLRKINKTIDIGDDIDDNGNIIVSNSRQPKSKCPITNRDDVENLYYKAQEECVINKQANVASYKIDLPSKAEHKAIPLADVSVQTDKRNAAFIGTIVHRLMELLVLARNSIIDKGKIIEQVINEFDVKDESDLNALHKALDETKHLFDKLKQATEVYCELPFCYKKNETTICEGVMDLVYQDSDGWHIIDYKTNFDDRFLDIKYESQLDAYKFALKQILGVDATAEIYHIAV